MDDLQTAPESLERFWRHLFGGEAGMLHVWTGERDGERLTNPKDANFNYPKASKAATEWALGKSGEGREVYFCAHLLNGPKRRKEHAAGVRTLWGDLDGAEIPNGQLKPTAVVESSPGRFHVYWRLDSDIPPQTAEQLNRRLATRIGADPSGFDLTQLLRVPGTTNGKYEGSPTVRLVGLDAGRVYSAAELAKVLPRPKPNGSGASSAQPVGEEIPEGSRNEKLTSMAGALRRRGLDKAGILAALQGVNQEKCRPPLSEPEVAKIAASVSRYKPESQKEPKPERPDNREQPKTYALSDLGNAERFVDMHGGRVRWCPQLKSWLVYDGKRWARDEYSEVVRLAHKTARSIYRDAEDESDTARQRDLSRFALASQNETRVRGMLSQAKPYLGVGIDALDADPWVINCPNGTLDLRTGKLVPHDPADLLSKLAPVEHDPNADCPRFKQFLKEVLVDDDVISFVKRFTGYTLSGITRERLFAILHGSGKNGNFSCRRPLVCLENVGWLTFTLMAPSRLGRS